MSADSGAGRRRNKGWADTKSGTDGTRLCALGYCRGPVAGGSAKRYCSDEHAALAKQKNTWESRAREVSEQYLEAAFTGTTDPPGFQGWLTNQTGVVITGQAAIELSAAAARALDAALRLDPRDPIADQARGAVIGFTRTLLNMLPEPTQPVGRGR